MKKTYFDYAATTPLRDEVLEAMLPYFQNDFGNPSSIHYYGQKADSAVEEARYIVGGYFGVVAKNVIFTSGGTEANNLALRGVMSARKAQSGKKKLVITPVEHHAVETTASDICETFDYDLHKLRIGNNGLVDLSILENILDEKIGLVSIIYGNNEIGTINPIREIGKLCKRKGIPFHSDAVQAAGYLNINLPEENIDLLSIGAHKFYGPKGVGALILGSEISLHGIQTGGAQERGMRAGTQNVPYIVGMAKALQLARENLEVNNHYLVGLRDHMILRILNENKGAMLTGHPNLRLPNHASFVFPGVDGNQLLMLLDQQGFACSSGSACKTGSPEPSGVLLALGIDPITALGSLRLTLGVKNTLAEVDSFCNLLPSILPKASKLYGGNNGG